MSAFGAGLSSFSGTRRFEVLSRLGSGGMGVVYEALDRQRNVRVALKTLPSMSADGLLRLKHEFHALQDLHHPNLVSLGELISEAGQWFFTMELIDGEDLLHHVRPRASGLDEWRLRAAFSQLAEGLLALHSAQKVHRDIKPSNVMVARTARVVLLDFGLVHDVLSSDKRKETNIFGTASYMAPEQAGSRPVGPEADWYSVGVILYQALTGQLPISGHPLEVLVKKQSFVPAPARELAPDVPADLDELARALMRIDPAARPGGAEILARLGMPTESSRVRRAVVAAHEAPRFVGRGAELRALEDFFRAAARSGRPQTVVIQGESGIGKSALIRRFVERLGKYGALVLSGRCYERESVPFKAFDGLVDELSEHLRRLPPATAARFLPRKAALLVRVFPVLGRVEPLANSGALEGEALDPQELRSRVFSAMRELFVRLAEEQPVVLVIDDLQWADADSFAMLAALLRPPSAPPLMVISSIREESKDAVGSHVSPRLVGEVRVLSLGPLPAEDARALAAALIQRAGGSPDGARAIALEAGGHPLFIDELVWHALGSTGQDAGATGQDRGGLLLEAALCARIAALIPRARHVLTLIAVSTTPLAEEIVARAAGVERGEFTKMVAALRGAHLVRAAGFHGADALEPYHDRVRVAALGQLGAEQRMALHARLAEALEASGCGDPEALAIHWEGAGERVRALAHAETAGDQAMVALAFDRAARLYAWAQRLEGARAVPSEALAMKLGDALANAGRGAQAAEAYRAAARLASEQDRVLDLERRAAEQLLRSGHIDAGLAVVERVLAQLGMNLPETPRAALLSLLFHRARLHLRGLGYRRRREAEVPARDRVRIDVTWSVAAALGMVDTIRGAEFQTRCLLMALEAGEPTRIARALAMEACFSAARGLPAAARTAELIAAARALAHEVGSAHAIGLTVHAAALEAFFLGRFKIARVLEEEAEAIFLERCQGTPWEVTTVRLFHLSALSYLGEIDALSSRLPGYLKDAMERGDLYRSTDFGTGPLNVAWLARDDAAGARLEAEEAIKRWSRQGFHVQHYDHLIAETQIDLYLGRGSDAFARVLARWPALARSLLMHVQLVKVDALFLRARCALARAAELAPADRRRREVLAVVERDARAIAEERMPWAEGLVLLLRGVAAALDGNRDAGVVALARAEAAFEAQDMALHAMSARRHRGLLLGGDAGAALVASADRWMSGQRIVHPERIAWMIAPGL